MRGVSILSKRLKTLRKTRRIQRSRSRTPLCSHSGADPIKIQHGPETSFQGPSLVGPLPFVMVRRSSFHEIPKEPKARWGSFARSIYHSIGSFCLCAFLGQTTISLIFQELPEPQDHISNWSLLGHVYTSHFLIYVSTCMEKTSRYRLETRN